MVRAAGGSENVAAGGASPVGGERHRAARRGPGAGRTVSDLPAPAEPEPRWTLITAALGTGGAAAPGAVSMAAPGIRPGPSAPRGQGYCTCQRPGWPTQVELSCPECGPRRNTGISSSSAPARGRTAPSEVGPWGRVSHVVGWSQQSEVRGAPTFGLLNYRRRLLSAGRRNVSQM